jgi:ABC-type amino acid transport substrate-binding protein
MLKIGLGIFALVTGSACIAQTQIPELKLVVLQPLDRPNIVAEKAILDQAFARAGMRYALTYNPPERAMIAFKEGHFDGDINREGSFNQSYAEAIRVEPHIQGGFFFAIGASSSTVPKAWADLTPHRIAYVRGYRAIELRTAAVAAREVTYSEEACLKMAETRRVDWCILGSDRSTEWPLQAAYADRLTGYMFDSVKVYIWLGPQHKEAATKLSKALREMERSGALQKGMAPFRLAE